MLVLACFPSFAPTVMPKLFLPMLGVCHRTCRKSAKLLSETKLPQSAINCGHINSENSASSYDVAESEDVLIGTLDHHTSVHDARTLFGMPLASYATCRMRQRLACRASCLFDEDVHLRCCLISGADNASNRTIGLSFPG